MGAPAVSLPNSVWPGQSSERKTVSVLLFLALILLLFGIVGGLAITKFLFFVLIVAALLGAIGFFSRTA
jgi:hypothetical protein